MSKSRRIWHAMLLLSVPIATLAQNAPVQPQPIAIEGAITHVYKSIDGVELRLHIFNPQSHSASVKRPAIVFFFGGGWTGGSVEQFAPQSRQLAQRGMIGIVADYRVLNRHHSSAFQAMADAKSAIRWVRSHATELGIDPNRIAAGGGSSGGHLALSSAVFESFDETAEDHSISTRPNALVLFNPAVDTTAEGLKDRFGDRGNEASPVHHVRAGLPPMVIFHGRSDTTVPYATIERFCKAANDAGGACQLFGYEGATHGFFNPSRERGKWYTETLLEADRFLTKIGYLSEPVPKPTP